MSLTINLNNSKNTVDRLQDKKRRLIPPHAAPDVETTKPGVEIIYCSTFTLVGSYCKQKCRFCFVCFKKYLFNQSFGRNGVEVLQTSELFDRNQLFHHAPFLSYAPSNKKRSRKHYYESLILRFAHSNGPGSRSDRNQIIILLSIRLFFSRFILAVQITNSIVRRRQSGEGGYRHRHFASTQRGVNIMFLRLT